MSGDMITMAAATPSMNRAAALAQLNDTFRRTLVGGRVVITPGVAALGEDAVRTLVGLVAAFTKFDADNDPYGEHDFGSLNLDGLTYFWKIDCYDRACEFGSPDLLDPAVTCRVLTIMRADEY